MTTSESEDRMPPGTRLVIIAVSLVGIAGITWVSLQAWSDWCDIAGGQDTWIIRGASGDFWGGHFGTLAGFVGIALMFIALLLQKAELSLQRNELRLSRVELSESRKVAQAQAVSLDEHTVELRQQKQVAQFQNDVQFTEHMARLALDLYATASTHERWKTAASTAMRYICRRALEDPERALDLVDLFELSLLRQPNVNVSSRSYLWPAVRLVGRGLGEVGAGESETWEALALDRIDRIREPV